MHAGYETQYVMDNVYGDFLTCNSSLPSVMLLGGGVTALQEFRLLYFVAYRSLFSQYVLHLVMFLFHLFYHKLSALTNHPSFLHFTCLMIFPSFFILVPLCWSPIRSKKLLVSLGGRTPPMVFQMLVFLKIATWIEAHDSMPHRDTLRK